MATKRRPCILQLPTDVMLASSQRNFFTENYLTKKNKQKNQKTKQKQRKALVFYTILLLTAYFLLIHEVLLSY